MKSRPSNNSSEWVEILQQQQKSRPQKVCMCFKGLKVCYASSQVSLPNPGRRNKEKGRVNVNSMINAYTDTQKQAVKLLMWYICRLNLTSYVEV